MNINKSEPVAMLKVINYSASLSVQLIPHRLQLYPINGVYPGSLLAAKIRIAATCRPNYESLNFGIFFTK